MEPSRQCGVDPGQVQHLLKIALAKDARVGATLDAIERAVLHAAYLRHAKNWPRVAQALKIPTATLYERRRRYWG